MRRLLFLALFACPARLHAQVIDQYQPYGPGIFGAAGLWETQTFTPSRATIVGGGFQLYHTPDATETNPVEIRLYDGAANAGGTLLASGTTQVTFMGHAPAWADVFWSPVGVTIGATYWLYVRDVAEVLPSVYVTYADNAYAGGRAQYTNSVAVDAPFVPNNFGYVDLSFRTWAPTPDVPPVTPAPTTVPEPSSMALVAVGLLGLLRCRRTATPPDPTPAAPAD